MKCTAHNPSHSMVAIHRCSAQPWSPWPPHTPWQTPALPAGRPGSGRGTGTARWRAWPPCRPGPRSTPRPRSWSAAWRPPPPCPRCLIEVSTILWDSFHNVWRRLHLRIYLDYAKWVHKQKHSKSTWNWDPFLHKIDQKWIVWILRSLKLKRPNIRWTLLTLCFKAYLAQ